ADDAMFWVVDEGMVETSGVIEVANAGVVDEGMVETSGVIEVTDVAVKDGVRPSCGTTGDRMSEVTVVRSGAKTEALIRDGGKDMGMP
ncbi:hypothetical protein KI387_032463, partial [Taxus chinensis]